LGEVEVLENVSVVTEVGRKIRRKLPELGHAMGLFENVTTCYSYLRKLLLIPQRLY
jgi:sorbitol-specific phosphotransferase system component IIA